MLMKPQHHLYQLQCQPLDQQLIYIRLYPDLMNVIVHVLYEIKQFAALDILEHNAQMLLCFHGSLQLHNAVMIEKLVQKKK